jgi:hypothetical protein
VDVEPPRPEHILANPTSQPNEMLANLVAIKLEIPLAPSDVLKRYEQDITFVPQIVLPSPTGPTAHQRSKFSRSGEDQRHARPAT